MIARRSITFIDTTLAQVVCGYREAWPNISDRSRRRVARNMLAHTIRTFQPGRRIGRPVRGGGI